MSDEFTCRICLEDDVRANVIAPCKCNGGSKWVHRPCLDQWRTMNEDRAFARCTECLENYTLVNRAHDSDSPAETTARKRMYCLHVTRDFSAMFLLSQGVIAIFSLITYSCDSEHGTLMHEFGMTSHPKVFYYLCGIVFVSATIGMIGLVGLICGGSSGHAPNSWECFYLSQTSQDCCAADCCAGCECCEGCQGCGRGCRACTCRGGDTAHCCTGCTAADCSGASCSGAQCGEAGPFVLVIVAGLALIGVIVSVVAGVVFAQRIMQQHMHFLHKQGLARDFVVADLAAEDNGLAALEAISPIRGHHGSGSDSGGGISMGSIENGDSSANLGNNNSNSNSNSNNNSNSNSYHNNSISNPEPSAPVFTPLHRDDVDIEMGVHAEHREGESLMPRPSAPPLSLQQRRLLADLGLL